MNRRELLGAASMGAVVLAAGTGMASAKMVPPWVWTDKHGLTNKMIKDKNPLKDEFKKYPRCPYCGMARQMWSHTRHLIQYDDDSTEGTCSIHCASLSLALNMDRNPKNIWVGDAGSEAKVKPLVNADKAFYAINPGKPGTMTGVSKWAYADEAKAKAAGGEVVNFDSALQAAYGDMAKNTLMIRKRRAEKRAHMMKKMKMMKKDK